MTRLSTFCLLIKIYTNTKEKLHDYKHKKPFDVVIYNFKL